MNQLSAWTRMLPVMVWLLTQFGMALSMPAAAASAYGDPELRALQNALGISEIVLCTPDGKQEIGDEGPSGPSAQCHWCQAFSLFTAPDRPGTGTRRDCFTRVQVVSQAAHTNPKHPRPDRHAPRAPPTGI
ncbi:MAG: hypothetical protein AAF293_17515 [Pseudomonadota bacterium]